MKLYSSAGGFVEVDEERAERLFKRGGFSKTPFTEDAAESASETLNIRPEGDDTPEVGSEPQEPSEPQEEAKADKPDVAVVRAWAKENGVEVSDQGRIPKAVYDKYADAHKN